ncbi:MAG: hypothetical protein GZ094_18850 [Mariniphaga sp.]|nr:hypothetical protein [Mariniphaga sp.]
MKNQNYSLIEVAFSGAQTTITRGLIRPDLPDIFLLQNAGKSPPGCARSSGSSLGLHTEILLPVNGNRSINRKIKSKKIYFNIMKKQIFILVILVVAVFANVTNSFGQMTNGSGPQALTCSTGPLAPLAGVPYNYAATVLPATGDFQWWATKDFNFISTGVNNFATNGLGVGTGLKAASINYGVKGGATNAANVSITWPSATLVATTVGSPTFVVVQNDAISPNCANNLKVYQIFPKNGFTVDIKNMDQSKVTQPYSTAYSFCASNIASATYVVGTGIVTDYGISVLYFEVVAANFTDGYTPSFKVTGLASGQTVTSLQLSVSNTFAPTIPTVKTGIEYKPVAALTIDPAVTNTGFGVSVYVKLTIANGTHENTVVAGDNISLAVDGINNAGQSAVLNTNCDLPSAYSDVATQTINPRPAVTAVAATGTFVTN